MHQSHRMTEEGQHIEITVACMVRKKDGTLLLIRSPKHSNRWVLIGGHVEPGEEILDAAVREVKEEVDLTTKPCEVIGFGQFSNPPAYHREGHFIYFLCLLDLVDENAMPVLDPKEATEYVFMSAKEAQKADVPKEYLKDFERYAAWEIGEKGCVHITRS